MAEKYLPIQFFEKRKDFDDRATEGGRDSKLPSWVLTGSNLLQRSTQLVSEINDVTSVLRGHKQSGKKLLQNLIEAVFLLFLPIRNETMFWDSMVIVVC